MQCEFVEIYSKRSSLGCPYPIFVLTWHMLSVVPAAIQVLVNRHKAEHEHVPELESLSPNISESPEQRSNSLGYGNATTRAAATWPTQGAVPKGGMSAPTASAEVDLHQRHLDHASAIHGGGDP